MRRTLPLLLFLVLTAVGAGAEIIDRIMAVVHNRVVTLSDVRRADRVRAVLGYPAIEQKQLVRELVDAELIEEQIAQFFGVQVTDAEVDEVMKSVSDLGGLPVNVVRDAVRRRLRADQFFELRFRQFLKVTDADVADYYNKIFVPAAQKKGGPVPTLEQVSDMIRENVIQEKVAQEVESWLAAIRRRSDIEIFD
jgi:peptidyl-prolyl cis-trans isomerase SurA